MHGMQVWVALPKENEDEAPSFHHIPAEDVPRWETNGLQCTLIVGEAFGQKNPAPTASPLFYVDLQAKTASTLPTDGQLFGEWALYVLEGRARLGDTAIEAQHMAVLELGAFPEVHFAAGTRALIFGGEKLPEERHIFWNFVHSNPQKIEAAKARWKAQKFPKIEGEDSFVPLPE
jgi:redox-sensitive bicupin YhaK (pirin superfamily)